jgi:hypothetical protein
MMEGKRTILEQSRECAKYGVEMVEMVEMVRDGSGLF